MTRNFNLLHVGIAIVPIALAALLMAWLTQDQLLGVKKLNPPDKGSRTIELPRPGDFPHGLLDEVQRKFVRPDGLVDFRGVGFDDRFREYVATLALVSPSSHPELFPSPEHGLVYWCNAYNALVFWGVFMHLPMSSVQDFEAGGAIEVRSGQGFFYALRFELGGEWINLYDLENTIIRGYGDARIHAAINCASKGCPTLANFAFLPGKMDAQFDAVMETMVAEKRNLEIDHEGKVVRASSIFDWFRSDFEGEGGLMAYWSRFASEEKAAELARARDEDYQIEFVPYDWGIIAVSMN